MVFPQVDNAAAPSVAALPVRRSKASLLFVILWIYAQRPRPMGAVSGLFLLGYGSFRFIAEFAREPDDFLGLPRARPHDGAVAVAADDRRRGR